MHKQYLCLLKLRSLFDNLLVPLFMTMSFMHMLPSKEADSCLAFENFLLGPVRKVETLKPVHFPHFVAYILFLRLRSSTL